MAANGMFGAGDGGMINPPHPNRSFTVSMCEVAVRNQEISGLMRDLKLIMDMKEVEVFSVNFFYFHVLHEFLIIKGK